MHMPSEVNLVAHLAVLLLIVLSRYGQVADGRHTASSTDTDMSFIRTCNETSPVSLVTINEVLVHKRLNNGGETYHFKCFLHCLFTMYGWMDREGGFLLVEMRQVLEETLDDGAVLEYLLYRCTAIESADRCHRAFIFTQCFWEKLDQHPHLGGGQEETYFYNLDQDQQGAADGAGMMLGDDGDNNDKK